MNVGITGHQYLQEPSAWTWVSCQIVNLLTAIEGDLVGVTSLALGADTLFADIVLGLGGRLHVIIPFDGYESNYETEADRTTYDRLLASATWVEVLPKAASEEESYFCAGKRVVDLADLVVAVWNGRHAVGLGGTGDVVSYAQQEAKRIYHINPVTHEMTVLPSGHDDLS